MIGWVLPLCNRFCMFRHLCLTLHTGRGEWGSSDHSPISAFPFIPRAFLLGKMCYVYWIPVAWRKGKLIANHPDNHAGPQFIHLQNGLVVGNQTRKAQRCLLGFQLHCEVDSQWVLVLPPVSRCSPRKGSWEAQGDVWGLEELPPVPCNFPVQVEVLLP